MDRDRFHNQLAISIGYKLINDKRFTLEVEDSDDPWVTLKVHGCGDIRFRASGNADDVNLKFFPKLQKEAKEIVDATHHAFLNAKMSQF